MTVSVDGGSTSPSVPVVTAATALVQVENPGTSIAVSWTPASGTTTSYVQLLRQGSGQAQSWMTSDDHLTIGHAVSGQGWQILVRGAVTFAAATSYGPPASAPVITVRPQLTRVNYSGSDVQLVWAPLRGYTRFLAALEGAAPRTKSVTGISATFPGALAGTGWQATVSAQSADGVAIGPKAPAVAVILTAPSMSQVSYLPPDLTLSWALVPGQSSYAATLWRGNESVSQSSSGDTSTFPGPFSGTDWKCSVRAQSADGVSLGPPSPAYRTILAPAQEVSRL